MAIAALNRVMPHVAAPKIIYKQAQEVPFMKYFGGNVEYLDIEGVEKVYFNVVDGGGNARASRSSMSQSINEIFVRNSQIEAGVYYIQARSVLADDEDARAGKMGLPLQALQNATAQSVMGQAMHRGALFGFNGASGEGLINATGVASTALPTGSGGETSIEAYDAGELYQYLLGRINVAEAATRNMARVTYIATSVLIYNYIVSTKVLPATAYAITGGPRTIAAAINETRRAMGLPEIDFIADDSLAGKGSSSKDLIILGLPKMKQQSPIGFELNALGNGPMSDETLTGMIFGSADLIRKTAPIGTDAMGSTYKIVATPAIVKRPEGLYLISATAAAS